MKGLHLLTESGLKEQQARTVIGRLRKILRNDDTALIEIVNAAEHEHIAKPVPWLIAAAEQRSGKRSAFARIEPASEEQSTADADRALALLGAA